MKTMKMVLVVFLMVLFSCGSDTTRGIEGEQGIQGNEGLVGPAGPEGPQGKTGLTGPRGAAGAQGAAGPAGEPATSIDGLGGGDVTGNVAVLGLLRILDGGLPDKTSFISTGSAPSGSEAGVGAFYFASNGPDGDHTDGGYLQYRAPSEGENTGKRINVTGYNGSRLETIHLNADQVLIGDEPLDDYIRRVCQ